MTECTDMHGDDEAVPPAEAKPAAPELRGRLQRGSDFGLTLLGATAIGVEAGRRPGT